MNRRAVVEPGVTNLEITGAAAPHGLYYAPDPSSQQVCTIGGNVAENSGGAHCLKYGFTINHVLSIEAVLPDGSVVTLGADTGEQAGPDLRGVFLGSEGTLGIATKVVVRLLRTPGGGAHVLADFPSVAAAGDVVSRHRAAGIVPAAMEMMDTLAIEAAEEACTRATRSACRRRSSSSWTGRWRSATSSSSRSRGSATATAAPGCTSPDTEERAAIWRGRKAAFAAVGRDQPRLLRAGRRGAAHPARRGARPDRGDGRRGRPAGGQRLPRRRRQPAPAGALQRRRRGERARRAAVAARSPSCAWSSGGSLSGEHGIGTDKACSMPKMFSRDDLAAMQRLRAAFDPERDLQPRQDAADAAAVRGTARGSTARTRWRSRE